MPTPIVFEVCPVENAWLVRIAGDSLTEVFADKGDAVARARALMKRESVARLRVLAATGEVETEVEHHAP